MQKHIKVYLEYYGLMQHEVMCEVCGAIATDIHHIIYRSKFGKKMLKQQDSIENLIGLCRNCHRKAHSGEYSQEYLQKIHTNNL